MILFYLLFDWIWAVLWFWDFVRNRYRNVLGQNLFCLLFYLIIRALFFWNFVQDSIWSIKCFVFPSLSRLYLNFLLPLFFGYVLESFFFYFLKVSCYVLFRYQLFLNDHFLFLSFSMYFSYDKTISIYTWLLGLSDRGLWKLNVCPLYPKWPFWSDEFSSW